MFSSNFELCFFDRLRMNVNKSYENILKNQDNISCYYRNDCIFYNENNIRNFLFKHLNILQE